MMSEVTALIADDEPLARRALRGHLATVKWVGEIFEASDGLAAIRAVNTLRPHLLFLDVMMPGASGMAVVEQIEHRPHIIFTTAFDRFAVTAFEIGALDYLLKPFGRERVTDALDRARVALSAGLPSVAVRAAGALWAAKPISSLFVKENGRIVRIAVEHLERLEACDDYVALYVEGRRHLMHVGLRELHARLDRERFLRIHRSHIVNVNFVKTLEPAAGSRFILVMRDGTRLRASRDGSATLRSLMGVRSKVVD
jgi:two-component system LytT family response regulator